MLCFLRQPEPHCTATSPRTASAWLAMALLMLVAALFAATAFAHESPCDLTDSHTVFVLANDLAPEPSSGDGNEAEPDVHASRIQSSPNATALSAHHHRTSGIQLPMRGFAAYRGQAPPQA